MKQNKLLIIIMLIGVLLTSFSYAETILDSCGTISESGEYGLYSDLNWVSDIGQYNKICFDIVADNVLIDCNGNAVTDFGNTESGIFAKLNNVNNITIQNCELEAYNKTFFIEDSNNVFINDNNLKFAYNVLFLKQMAENSLINFNNNDIENYGDLVYVSNSEEIDLNIFNNNFLRNYFTIPKFLSSNEDVNLDYLIPNINSNYFHDYKRIYPKMVYKDLTDNNNNKIYDTTELTNEVYICYNGWLGENETCNKLRYESEDLSEVSIDIVGTAGVEVVKIIGLVVILLIIGYLGSMVKYRLARKK